MLNYELKFITSDESVIVKSVDFKTSKYETKKKNEESVFDQGKRSFCERRGGLWRAPRPRILREFENKLRDRIVVFCEWMSDTIITVIFSTGAIAYLTVNPETLDIVRILFDRYCIGKLSGQSITGVVFSTTHLLFTHTESTATLVTFTKNITGNVPYRIADQNPHVQIIELADGARRAERRLSWGEAGVRNTVVGSNVALHGPRVLIWTAAGADPAPWTPAAEIRANLYLYQLKGQQMNVIAFHQLENETLSAEVSRRHHNIVHIVEQVTCHKSGISLTWVRYDVPEQEEGVVRLTTHQAGATSVLLPAVGRAVTRSPCDRRVSVACIDGSMHVVHIVAGLTHSTRAGFIPTEIHWSRDMVICAEEGARLQLFDRALTLMQNNAKCIHLAHHFRETRGRMRILSVCSIKGGALLLILFSGGPLALLRVTHPQLPLGWIRTGRISRAVAWLRAMDWEHEGDECLRALHAITMEIRRGALGAGGEATLQAALGTCLGPSPASTTPSTSTSTPAASAPASPPRTPRPAVIALARTFFHMLLRRSRVDKSLSLGVSLGAWDLFSDARCAASRCGRDDLAVEARDLALHYQHLELDRDSECSSSCSCSHSGTESSGSPPPPPPPLPPLPRLQPPTLVPIHQSEPYTQTHPIRPNLHQYLERDLSIWNTDVPEQSWRNLNEGRNTRKSVMDVGTDRAILYQRDTMEEPYRHQNRFVKVSDRRSEKNVKFSDTVTITVLAEGARGPQPARELAESLPLCAPHAYLAAFEPAPTPAAASAPAPAPATAPAPAAAAAENAAPKPPPKIKVVHFGMV